MSTPRIVHLSLSADGSLLREETLNGVKYLVCPVISKLGDNVEWPINAPTPEFIPAHVLDLAVANRNNRPVVMGHPQDENGNYISANDPLVIEKLAYGFTFGAKFENNQVSSEMWLDPIRAEKVPLASRVIERLQNGEMVEVSEGDYVLTEIEDGQWNGKVYGARWVACWSDHLATLPEGQIGACSIDDGCGANRVSMGLRESSKLQIAIKSSALTQARRPTFTGTETSTWTKPTFADYVKYLYNGDDPPLSVAKCSQALKTEISAHTLLGDPNATNFSDLTSHAVVNPSNGYLNENALRSFLNDDNNSVKEMVKRLLNSEFSANLPDKKVEVAMGEKKVNPLKRMLESMANTLRSAMSNNDLRWKLYKAIEKVEPGISFVHDEDVAAGEVFYCVVVRYGGDYWEDGEREYHNYKRTFTIDEKEHVTVNDDAIEIEWFQGWKPLGEATPRPDTNVNISAASKCGCQKGEDAMAFDRKSVITRLSNLTNGPFTGNLKALEAMDDKGLENLDKAFPDKVEEKKETTTAEPTTNPTNPPANPPAEPTQSVSISREEYTKMLAASNAYEAQQAAHKSTLVSTLKTAQSEFSEVDLNSMEVPQLERIARLVKVDQPNVSNASYVGLPIPKDVAKPIMRDLPDPLGLKVHGLRPDGRELIKDAN